MAIHGLESHLQEFHDLRKSAVAVVRRGFAPAHEQYQGGKFLFQFIEEPSLSGSTIGWQVYRRHRNQESPISHIGARTEWCHAVDAEKFRTPVERLKYPLVGLRPTICRRQLSLDSPFIEPMWSDICRASIPFRIGEAHIVLDGVDYEFTFGDSWANMEIHWKYNGPDEWQALIKPVMALYDALEKHYAAQNDEV